MQQMRNPAKVVKYIRMHITEPIHLSDAAGETGVSSAYLSTIFKKEIGYNFIEYVNLRKTELARQMLQEGKMVYEVSATSDLKTARISPECLNAIQTCHPILIGNKCKPNARN